MHVHVSIIPLRAFPESVWDKVKLASAMIELGVLVRVGWDELVS